jgi:hypothetical protein
MRCLKSFKDQDLCKKLLNQYVAPQDLPKDTLQEMKISKSLKATSFNCI